MLVIIIILIVLLLGITIYLSCEHNDGSIMIVFGSGLLLGLLLLHFAQTMGIDQQTEQYNIPNSFYEAVMEYSEDADYNDIKVAVYFANVYDVPLNEALEKQYNIPADKADAIVNLYFE